MYQGIYKIKIERLIFDDERKFILSLFGQNQLCFLCHERKP